MNLSVIFGDSFKFLILEVIKTIRRFSKNIIESK